MWLQGEAFFDIVEIQRDSAAYATFTVHTDRLRIAVLGTSFNVQGEKETARVVLNSGRVELISDHEKMSMEPGELAEILPNRTAIHKKVVNPAVYSAWTQHQLLCDDTSLADISVAIERRYGKRVVFQDASLRSMTITGTLPLRPLSLLTHVLEESLPITVHTYEETLSIRQEE